MTAADGQLLHAGQRACVRPVQVLEDQGQGAPSGQGRQDRPHGGVQPIEGEAVFLELLRDVDAGEELCLAYSEYARERFGIA